MNDFCLGFNEASLTTTPQDICLFYEKALRRTEYHLVAAYKRNDSRAVEALKRKVYIYKYTLNVLKQSLLDDGDKFFAEGSD